MDHLRKCIKKRIYIEAFWYNYEIPIFFKPKYINAYNMTSITNQLTHLDINHKIKKSIFYKEILIIYIVANNFTKYNYCYENILQYKRKKLKRLT